MIPRYYAVPTQTALIAGRGLYVFGIEKMPDVKDEIAPLHRLHWDEVERGHTPLEMDVAYDKYAAFEDRGQFILFTVRAEPKLDLVGYFMCYMHRANHAQQELVAREDALFIVKEHRGGGLANHLLTYVEQTLKGFNCKTLSTSSRHYAGGTNLTNWLVGRGYKPSAVVFVKEL